MATSDDDLAAIRAREATGTDMLLAQELCDAAAVGDLEAMSVAYDRAPATVNGRSRDGWSPLHLAGFYGHVDAARWLLERGAAVEAISTGREANRPLHAALAGAGNPALVELLVARGADVCATGASGITPLHIAASRGSEQFVALLRAGGADPQAAMHDGRTPADLAAERNFPALADQLRAMR